MCLSSPAKSHVEYAWFTASDSVPVVLMNVTRATRITGACIHGQSEIHLEVTAKLAAFAQGIAPSLARKSPQK